MSNFVRFVLIETKMAQLYEGIDKGLIYVLYVPVNHANVPERTMCRGHLLTLNERRLCRVYIL